MREVSGKKEFLDEETGEWVSKNELKTREKLRKKKKDADAKAQKKGNEEKKVDKKAKAGDEDIDPSKYTDNRKAFLQDLKNDGQNPYPHKFQRDMTIPQFREKYEPMQIDNSVFLENEKIAITGRVIFLRPSGAKLLFIDLNEDGAKL